MILDIHTCVTLFTLIRKLLEICYILLSMKILLMSRGKESKVNEFSAKDSKILICVSYDTPEWMIYLLIPVI